MTLNFAVPPEADGMLLRGFLHRCGVSADLSRAVKQAGGYFADGVPVHTNVPVQAGQMLSFALPPEAGAGTRPQPELPLCIAREDAMAIVLDKPAGMAVHPTRNYPDGTLANAYAARMQARGESGVFRPVNRIDKNTSGLVLAAASMYAAPLLAQRAEKTYLAFVQGDLPQDSGVIDAPIAPRGDSIIGRCVSPEGKPSRTEYTVLRRGGGLTLAACRPVTGRTHQIRVHFAWLGYPLAGDDLYGGSCARIARHALHCSRIVFSEPHAEPCAGGLMLSAPPAWDTVSVESPLPADLQALLGAM